MSAFSGDKQHHETTQPNNHPQQQMLQMGKSQMEFPLMKQLLTLEKELLVLQLQRH